DPATPFSPDVSSLFPSKKSFERALRDLKRYVTYSPRDPAGLSVLGYMLFAQGDDERAKEMFQYLLKLPSNANDPFAGFFVKQIDARRAAARGGPTPVETPRVEVARPAKPAPPTPPPAPPKPPVAVAPKPPAAPPEAGRLEEEPAHDPPAPAP